MSHRFRIAYLIAAALFAAGVVTQLFLVGLVVIAGRIDFDAHRTLGHALALPLIAMLIGAHAGRLGPRLRLLTWILFGVYLLQADVVLFLRGSQPVVAALHPALAAADLVLAWVLLQRSWSVVRAGAVAPRRRDLARGVPS